MPLSISSRGKSSPEWLRKDVLLSKVSGKNKSRGDIRK
jgi:hypothetical protein